ncbi:MAG: DUF1080 domain-containing protein [Kiritimatiellae bacterium]|nr:DUF1080 domain-containing protein [Kiritimatiellia bacterium]
MKNSRHSVAARICALSAVFAAATTFGAIRAVTPTAWNGDPNCWQMKRHFEKMNAVTNGGAKVVFIGDSITHFWEGAGKGAWQKFFADGKYRAINLGTSADRTEHVLWRITEGRELDGYEAKCILLMIGTNNSGHFPFAKEPPIDTIMGIRHILEVIAEKQPKARVILTSIFPRGRDANDSYRRRNDVVNKEIATFADGKRVIWCDFSDKFLDAQGRLSRELFPDLLHPNARGYEIWASAVIPLIDRVLEAGEDECIPSVWPSSPTGYVYGEPIAAQSIRGSNYWPQRYLEKRNEIVDNGNVVYDAVFAGDSITHRWERKGGEGRKLFHKLREKYRILDLGYGGDRVEHLVWRFENGELEGYKTKLFMLMIGTNNGEGRRGGDGWRDLVPGIRRALDIIAAKHPEAKTLLLPIFPRGKDANDAIRMRNDKVNAAIKAFADGEKVIWLDFTSNFLDAYDDTKWCMNDRLHPNEIGYEIWWSAIKPYVDAAREQRIAEDPLVGSWEGDLPVDAMPATSLIFSRGEKNELKALVLYRWGSPEWCSNVVVDGALFSLRHPYGQLYRGKVVGDFLAAEFAPCDRETGKQTGDWQAFTARRQPEVAPADTAEAKFGEGVDLLKDGLDGWVAMSKDAKFGWVFENGVLSNKMGLKPDGSWVHGGANLMTKRSDFYDFNLSYDVRVPKGSNSGVYLRGRYECQVVDSYGEPVDRHNMAAYYGRVAPSVSAEKAPGEWQHVDVTLYRRHMTVVLNGVKIIDNAPVTGVTGGALDSNEFVPGPIYLQGDHSDADYRNMILRPAVN